MTYKSQFYLLTLNEKKLKGCKTVPTLPTSKKSFCILSAKQKITYTPILK